jgi:polyphosphate:AMP phosphotransferase
MEAPLFETAELGHSIDREQYEREEPGLREELLRVQGGLKESARFPVVIIVSGMDGAGRGETVNLLNAWMDPRLIETHAFGEPTEEEAERPRLYRYWRAMPPRGKIGIMFGGWYEDPYENRVAGKIKTEKFDNYLEEIVRLENMLVSEGTLLLKFWLHLSKASQKKRLQTLQRDSSTKWRVTDADWKRYDEYGRRRKIAEQMLRQTSVAEAPWSLVEGEDGRFRNLTIGTVLLRELKKHGSEERPAPPKRDAPPLAPPIDGLKVLDSLDLSLELSKEKYEDELAEWQGRLNRAMRKARFKKEHSVVAVFEGNDAAGKGGSIRRVTAALDARQYAIVPVAAPTEEERAQPYLWRFYRRVPRKGRMTIFDRSWYGRVLVERVEGLCSQDDWMRAYGEINDFEAQLVESGVIVVKFWLAISKDEQLARFKAREETSFKRFKIGEEDYRNRNQWDAYAEAVNDMVERTSTDTCPWTLVEANDKHYARIRVLRTIVEAIERA